MTLDDCYKLAKSFPFEVETKAEVPIRFTIQTKHFGVYWTEEGPFKPKIDMWNYIPPLQLVKGDKDG